MLNVLLFYKIILKTKNTMNTITYKDKEYQEAPEELFESCKGCAFEIEGCKRGLTCGENNSIYKEIDNPELTVLINYHKDQINANHWETQEK